MASSSQARPMWQLQEIIDYYSSDHEIAEELSSEDFNRLFNYEYNWIKLVRTALEYQGFGHKVILNQLNTNRNAYLAKKPERLEWDLGNIGDNMAVTGNSQAKDKFSNMEPLINDINFLITVFLSRNNQINKINKKARGGVDDILNMLKEKYMIDDDVRKSNTSLESRVITLPRIAGVFPGVAARMFHDWAVKEIVTYEIFPGTVEPLTHAICCPMLPSMCPIGLTKSGGNVFHSVMIWTAVKLDDIIHRKEKTFTGLSELLSYYRAGFQSNAVPEQARINMFLQLYLIKKPKKTDGDPVLELTKESKALANSCYNSLRLMVDENYELMLRVATLEKKRRRTRI